MGTKKQNRKQDITFLIPLFILVVFILMSMTRNADYKDEYLIRQPLSAQDEAASKAAFLKAYSVFMHPRCMNCHPAGDAPLQGDDSHVHTQNVKRGPDGKGLFALKCANCHRPGNVPGPGIPPGHELWHLPPSDRKMVFEGKSARELATHFMDNEFTGFKSWKEDLIHHVENEPLVLNSWTYGTPLPMSHEEFVAAVKEWIEKGAALPDE